MNSSIVKGTTIISRRKELGITQEDLAERIEVSPQTISNWENETTSIKGENIGKLAKALELTSAQLINATSANSFAKTPIEKAISYALDCHEGITQKGSDKPYILHPLEALQILVEMKADNDLVIAGVLHDAVEDSDATLDDVENKFGKEVRRLVESHTENKDLEWEERKENAIKELANGDLSVKKLILADALSNLRRMNRDYEDVGEDLWKRFNRGKEDQAWYYGENIKQFVKIEKEVDPKMQKKIDEAKKLYEQIFGRRWNNKIRVLYKDPDRHPQEIEVSGIYEMNELLGNFEEDGKPMIHSSSDICINLGGHMEMYINHKSSIDDNSRLNIYFTSRSGMIFGPLIISAYDENNRIVSLSDEQVLQARRMLIECAK